MDELSLRFLPFPHVYKGSRKEGSTHTWPARCETCDRQCESASSNFGSVELCSYGVNFVRVDNDLLIAGVVVREDPRQSKARAKMLRVVGRDALPAAHLDLVLERASTVAAIDRSALDLEKRAILDAYRDTEQYKRDIVELLRPSLEQTFAQVHDYRSLISQIVQNVNVILETAHPRLDLDAQLALTSPQLRSIYWAARLMEFKLQSALFLVYPERITDPRHKVYFRLHGAVHKYVGIYKPLIEQRNLRFTTRGESFGKLLENPDAVGVIPHAFLDNAIKYAPPGSEIDLKYSEDAEAISLQVCSLGPQIRTVERARVFELFFRADAARGSGEDGTGFGLGLAQHVADAIGAVLSVEQDPQSVSDGLHRTTFTARFSRPLAGEGPPDIVKARTRRRGGPQAGPAAGSIR